MHLYNSPTPLPHLPFSVSLSFLPLFCLQPIQSTLFFLPTQWNQPWQGHQTPFTTGGHFFLEALSSLGFWGTKLSWFSLAVPSQSHLLITPLCLLHPILRIQPHNTWSSRLVFGILFSLFPDDFMAFETIYMFMISRLYSQPSIILCTPDLYLCLFILQSSQNYHGQ